MQPGSVVAERFEIEALAGSGGMGSVYRARDFATGAAVALKLLRHEAVHAERFRREAELLAELVHPNIVRYVAHGFSRGVGSYIAMEWLEGRSLRERLLEGRLDLAESLLVAEQAANALGVAHEKRVVHRDVKPDNLFLVGDRMDMLKVLDFGVALAGRSGPRMTRTGVPMGTIGYMSPEQARGETDVDARADVFALGEVLFECLTGRPAFFATHPLAVLAKIIFEDAPRIAELAPSVPPSVEELVAQMLAKDRELRLSDGRAVAERVAAIRKRVGTGTVPDSAPRVSRVPARAPSLTASERRSVSVVVGSGPTSALDATLPLGVFEERSEEIREVAAAHGGRVETLGSSDFLVLFGGRPAASDIATRAARAALRFSELLPDAALAIVTGAAILTERVPIGDVVDRAAELLEKREARTIRIDEATAGLLPTRFELAPDPGGLVLRSERESAPSRLLLGKSMPCVGRERELETLDAIVDECLEESVARAVLVTGPPGVGKSRVCHELVQRLSKRQSPVEIWMGRGDPLLAGAPFALASDTIQKAFGLSPSDGQLSRQKLLTRVSAHVPEADAQRVSEFLGEVLGIPFPEADSVQLRAARRDAILMRDQIQRAWEDLLEGECRTHALLVVLEDLQWGDLPSVKLIDGALRRLAELPLLIIGVGRTDLHDALPGLWAERGLQEVRVRELSRRAASELVQLSLGGSASKSEVNALVDRAAGNALFLEELIRAHSEKRSELPGSVMAMVQARLEALDPEARRMLRAASVFGLEFPRDGLAQLLGSVEAEALERTVEALVAREILLRQGDGLAFCHTLVRDAAHAMLTESDRTLGHRLAGAWLAAHDEKNPVVLAEHFEKGGALGRAVPWWARAASDALDANDFVRCLDFAERGKSAGASGLDLGELELTRAGALRWTGRLQEALTSVEKAFALLPQGEATWCRAAAELALLLQRMGRGIDLVDLGRRLLAQSVRAEPDNALAYALVRSGLFLLLVGHRDNAFELVAAVEHLLERPGGCLEPSTLAQLHVFRAVDALQRSDLARYLEEEQQAKLCFDEVGDLRQVLNESGSIGYAFLELGAHQEAERVLEEALIGAERMGLAHMVAASNHNLGLVYARRGDFARARESELLALEVFRSQHDRRLEGAALAYLADIEMTAGNIERAAEVAQESIAALQGVAPLIAPYPEAILSRARLAQGRIGEALSLAAETVSRLESLGTAEAGDALARLAHAEALRESGDTAAAKRAITTARERLLDRAGRINDPELRNSFLSNVPENARTLELFESWS